MSEPHPTLWTRPFLLIWACTFLTFFAAFQLFPTAPLRLLELGASRAESGLFLAIFTGGSSLGALVTGQMADRMGHRRMLVISSTAFTLIMTAYAFMPVRWGFYALAPFHGAVWSGLLTSTSAMLGGILPVQDRAKGMSWYGLASPFGVVFGPSVGVAIYQHGSFRIMCLLLGLCFLALSLLARLLPVDAHLESHEKPPLQWPDRPVLMLSSVLLFVAFSYGALTSYSTQEAISLGFTWPSAFLSSLAMGMVVMRLVMAWSGFGERPARLIPWMLLLAIVGMSVMAFGGGPWELGGNHLGLARHVVAALIYGAGYSMVFTLLNAEVLNVVTPDRRGAAFGTFMFAFDAGIGLGSLLLGSLIGATSFAWGWRAGLVLMICGLPLTMGIARRGS
jgi:MFS family permease